MHEALTKHGVASELKLYEQGGHGLSFGREGTDSAQWPDDLIAWLHAVEIISPAKTDDTSDVDDGQNPLQR